MANAKKIREVGTSTNKKSDIIKRQESFLKRWNVELSKNDYETFKNRIITILSSDISSSEIQSVERDLFFAIGIPFTNSYGYDLMFTFDKTNLYHYLKKMDMSKQDNQIKLFLLLENLLNLQFDLDTDSVAKKISEAIALSCIDVQLCKRGREYMFYPSGAELLDIKLVNDTLNWLEDYPKAKEKFHEGLVLQQRHSSTRQVIDSMRLALELFVKQYNGNEKSLENQKAELGQYLKEQNVAKEIRDMFSTLFLFYTTYNNENVKHNDGCSEVESEYLIYLTGTFIRFLINVKKKEEHPND